jgi:nucleoside phosphorylase
VARVAQDFGLDVMLVKQISDSACELAGRSWSKNVDHCAEQLGAWLGAEFSAS